MRKSYPISIPANSSWPDGAQGDAPGRGMGKFNWIRWEHRSPANTKGVVVDFEAPALADGRRYFDLMDPGERRVRNIHTKDERPIWPDRVYLQNLDTVNAAIVIIEVSDEPIVDLRANRQVDLTQVAGTGIPNQASGPGYLPISTFDAGANPVNRLTGDAGGSIGAFAVTPALWNGASWDRTRSVSAVGDGLGVTLASQPSSTPISQASAVNTINTITYASVAGQSHRVTSAVLFWTAAAPGSAPTLTISDGTISYVICSAQGLYQSAAAPIPAGGLKFGVGLAVTLTVQAGGAAAVSNISASKITA